MKETNSPHRTSLFSVILPILGAASLLTSDASAGTFYWTGDHDSSWADSRNWSPSGVPGSSDDVIVSSGFVNGGAISRSVQSLTINDGYVHNLTSLNAGTITISGGQLSATNISTPQFNSSGGIVTGTSMSLSGDSTWTGGSILTSVTVASGASISIPSGVPAIQNRTLTNNGTVTMGGGQIQGYENATIENNGTWILSGHNTPFVHYYGGNQFNNHGLLQKTLATVHTLTNSWTYTLGGEIRSDTGTLELAGTTILPAGAQLTGTGTIQITGATQLTGTISENIANLQLAGGTITCSNTASITGTLDWLSGFITGTLTVQEGSHLTVSSTDLHRLNTYASIENHGTVTMAGGQIQGYDHGTIENHGTWILAGHDTPFVHYYGGNQFNNHGLLHGTGATTYSLANSWIYTLDGETRSDTGTLQFASSTVLPQGAQLTGTGTIQVTGGTTQLTGIVSENVTNLQLAGGTITCSNTAAITGTLDWLSGFITGTLTVQNGSLLVVSSAGLHRLNTHADIDNHGTIRWDGSGPIEGYEYNTIHNQSDGIFDIAADGSPITQHYDGNVFQNDGTLIKSAGAGTATLVSWTFQNDGFFVCDSGILECQSIVNLNDGSSLEGTSEVVLNGPISMNGTFAEAVNSLRMTGGSLTGNAPCGFTGQLDWEGGTVYGNLDVPVGSLLAVHGPNFKELSTSDTIEVYGTLRWTGTQPIRLRENSILHIHPGGNCDLAADGDPFDQLYGGCELINEGTLVKSAGSGGSTVCDALTIRNRGEIRCESATLEFANPAVLAFENTSSISGPGEVILRSTMQLPGEVDITAPTTWSDGNLTGTSGSLSGLLEWSGGQSIGSWQVNPGARLKIIDGTGGLKRLLTNANLDVAGVLEFASGQINQYETSQIHVLAGGRCEATGVASIIVSYGGNVLEIDPGGLLTTTAGGDLLINSAVINNGDLSLPAGSITCHGGGGPSTGTYHAESGASLIFSNGVHDLDAGSTVTGPGDIRITGGNLRAIAPVEVYAHLAGGVVEGLVPDGEFRFRDGSSWTSGYMSGNIRIPLDAQLDVDGSAGGLRRLNASARVDMEGSLRWQGPGSMQLYESNTIEIHPTGTIDFAGDGDPIDNYYGGSSLVNHGTILKSGGTGDSTLLDINYLSDGQIDCTTGRIAISAPFTLSDGGTITGAGDTVLTGNRTTLEGTTTIISSTLEIAGAELYGTPGNNGTLAGNNIEWSTGYIGGEVTWNGVAATTTSGFRRINYNSELRNAGTLTLGGSGSVQCWENCILRNLPTGILNATGSVSISQYYGGHQFINEGTMNIGSSPGRMTVTVPFEQTSTGRLVVGVAGSDSVNPDFDILVVQNTATLAGTLVTSLENGYDPPVGTLFEVVDAHTRIGTFEQVESPRFNVTYPFTTGTNPVSLHNVVLVAKDLPQLDYDTWASDNGLVGGDTLQSADPEGDGFNNLVEYALNMNPNVADTPPLTNSIESLDGGQWLVLHYRTWEDRINAGLLYQPEASSNLTDWPPSEIIDELDLTATVIPGSEARQCRILIDGTKHFLRLRFVILEDPS